MKSANWSTIFNSSNLKHAHLKNTSFFLFTVLNTGIVSKAQGSAYIEQGQTKAICAVYGPREIPRKSDFTMKGILNCTIERTPFSGSKRKAPGSRGDLEEDEMSKLLSEALEATVCMVSFFKRFFSKNNNLYYCGTTNITVH